MKIAFFTKYPPANGGIASQAAILIHGLAQLGLKISVFTYVEGNEKLNHPYLSHPNLSVFRLKKNNQVADLQLLDLFLKQNRKSPFDLIDSWYLLPYGLLAFKASQQTNLPYLIRHGGSDLGYWLQQKEFNSQLQKVLQKATGIITFAPHKAILRLNGVRPDQIILNQSESLDLGLFNWQTKPQKIKNSKDKPIIVFMGKPEKEKGICQLILALKLINQPFHLLVISQLTKELKSALKNLADNFTFLPFQPFYQVPALLAAASLVICPEYNYPIPNHHPRIGREAMAMAKPVLISNDLAQIWPYNQAAKKQALLVTDPRNLNSFANQIAKILANKNLRAQLSQNALKFTLSIENFPNYTQKTLQIYQSFI